MYARLLAVILLSISVAGCATTRRSQHVESQQLQGQVDTLQKEVVKKDQQITMLEGQLAGYQEKKFVEGEQPRDSVKRSEKARHKGSSNVVPTVSVRKIQKALKNAGFYKGPVDGTHPRQTKKAVQAFQKENGLRADGYVGEKTWAELSKHLD